MPHMLSDCKSIAISVLCEKHSMFLITLIVERRKMVGVQMDEQIRGGVALSIGFGDDK